MVLLARWTAIVIALAVLVGGGVMWLRPGGPVGPGAALGAAGGTRLGGPFHLVDQDGRAVTEASWPGRWKLIYFGYTTCPDVCPTELQTVVAALDSLGPLAARVVPIFITIDPERDTPAQLGEYVALFSDRLVGLTGKPEQIAAVAAAYKVYYAKVTPRDSTTYLMDHSSFLYLMAPDGALGALFGPGVGAGDIADAIRARLSGGS
jgi:cytochrome oxidase Cu insertion factor (SCO1/SenC/PrrC family)